MNGNHTIPKEKGMDHSFNVLREGYMFIPNRLHSFQSEIFETRLLGQRAICMGGEAAAELFYENEKFKRKGAAPKRLLKTLFGEKGVQTLDGEEHKHRKEMFMSLMSSERLQKLADIHAEQWEYAIDSWQDEEKIVLYEEAKRILCQTACHWAGVPLWANELQRRTDDLALLFEEPASLGPKLRMAKNARSRIEKWLGNLIDQVRYGTLHPNEDTALYTIAWHLDLNGALLDTEVAAVEMLNIIRPIEAIAIYINFCALALHHFPAENEKLVTADDTYFRMFVQEVRRFYPFFPFVAARVKEDFTWKGYLFPKNTLTLLDLYGTNHDETIWQQPNLFRPERFANWEENPFSFIPQGGGDYYIGHRCAGEWVTIEVMKVSLDYLANKLDFRIPPQDLSFSMVTMPSIPHSKIVMEGVRRK